MAQGKAEKSDLDKCRELLEPMKRDMEELVGVRPEQDFELKDVCGRMFGDIFDFAIAYEKVKTQLPADYVPAFVRQNAPRVPRLYMNMGSYLFTLAQRFIGQPFNGEDEVYELCRLRSGLQFFLDWFRPALVKKDEAEFEVWYEHLASIPQLDATIKKWLADEYQLDRNRIPKEIPQSHWWWVVE